MAPTTKEMVVLSAAPSAASPVELRPKRIPATTTTKMARRTYTALRNCIAPDWISAVISATRASSMVTFVTVVYR